MMRQKKTFASWRAGFSLVELMAILGLFSLLTSIVVFNIMRPQQQLTRDTTVSTLTADLRAQQLRAMGGDMGTTTTAQNYGIYFETGRYVLFQGSSYSAADASNFEVKLNAGLQLSTINVPSAQLVFTRVSGEVANYNAAQNTLTVKNITNNELKTIQVNRLGVVTVQ